MHQAPFRRKLKLCNGTTTYAYSRLVTRIFSYIVRVDSGFAPNPFHGFCTLATCKPKIRGAAQVGDWIVGTGSKSKGRDGKLVFAMRVEEAMSFQEYWEDPQFLRKRPDMKSTWDRACGDNIYYRDPKDSEFRQVPSYHCCPDGTSNRDMLVHDTKVDRVLVGADFIYWGGDGPPIPDFRGVRIAHTGVGHRSKFSDPVVREFVELDPQLRRRWPLRRTSRSPTVPV